MISVINSKLNCRFELRKGQIHTFLNPYSYLLLRQNPELLEQFDVVHFDGIALCRIYEMFRVRKVPRRSFDMTSIARDVLETASLEGKRVAFVGTEEGVVDKAVDTLQKAFLFEVALVRHGFFSSKNEKEVFQEHLLEIDPDIIIVGMGTGRQEQFLIQMKELGWEGSGFTCGGFLHQTAARLDFYPGILNRLNLRWLYRIWKDPYVIRRYLLDYPKFLVCFLSDYFSWRNEKPLVEKVILSAVTSQRSRTTEVSPI